VVRKVETFSEGLVKKFDIHNMMCVLISALDHTSKVVG